MKQEDLDRIAELEETNEFDELDEDEREELRNLKIERSQERKRGKSLAAWGKAKQVYKLMSADPLPVYALTEKPLHQIMMTIEIVDGKPVWVDGTDYKVERVDRPAITRLGYDDGQEIFWDLDLDPDYTSD